MLDFPFLLGKWGQGESYLQSLSAPLSELMAELTGKTVSIVGNARSLTQSTHGSEIDASDVVIRMHAAPLPAKVSHGAKTDWLALGMPVDQAIITARAPMRLLWMAKKRKRVRARLARRSGFYLHPRADWDRLRNRLNAPPTTGVMLIDLVAQSDASKIKLFGFDFFASLSLSGRRTAAQVPHDFAAEKEFVEALKTQDTRVVHFR